jgi:hypothetical protein
MALLIALDRRGHVELDKMIINGNSYFGADLESNASE